MSVIYKASAIDTICCYGCGLIGSGWAAHFLRAGLQVNCYDPREEAEEFLNQTLDTAWPTLEKLGLSEGASRDNLSFTTDPETALRGCRFVQESSVENEELKIELLGELDGQLDPGVIIASSSSGFLAENLRSKCHNGGRVIVGHPFNPPYLIPLVEIAGGKGADPEAVKAAMEFYNAIGSRPVVLEREIDGYIGNRLQMAVWKEILYMHSQGIASIEALDDAMVHGPALRWAAIGPSQTFFLGGRTPAEYRDFISLLVRELDEDFICPPDFEPDAELIDDYVNGVRRTWGDLSHDLLKANRDDTIVSLLQALKPKDDESAED